MTKLTTLLRTIVIAALLTLGLFASAPVAAQDETEEVVDETTEQVEETTDPLSEDDGGFDDWGLLGLLGLAGLAGLMRRPQPVVHDTERTDLTGTDTTRRSGDRIDDSTL